MLDRLLTQWAVPNYECGEIMDTTPQELYTLATLGTFAGSSGAVLVLYNTFRKLLKRENLWIAFVISLIVSFVVAFTTSALSGLVGYFLAFLNGCLLFTTASGTQELIATPPTQPTDVSPSKPVSAFFILSKASAILAIF